jgi:hypothetical protein
MQAQTITVVSKLRDTNLAFLEFDGIAGGVPCPTTAFALTDVRFPVKTDCPGESGECLFIADYGLMECNIAIHCLQCPEPTADSIGQCNT